MKDRHFSSSGKKAVNLTIDASLLAQAKASRINLSAMLEQALSDRLAEQARQQWREENASAIRAYNEMIESQGCFSDGLRGF